MTDSQALLNSIFAEFEKKSGLSGLTSKIIQKPSGPLMVIYLSNPSERFFKILEDIRKQNLDEESNEPLVTLKSKGAGDVLTGAEARLLLKTLTESQNVGRFSFESDFFARYTISVSGAELSITSEANHIVLGRRGAGKSMLLLYAWHTRIRDSSASVWIDMQVYNQREDENVVIDVVSEILTETSTLLKEADEHNQLLAELKKPNFSIADLRKILPRIRRLLTQFSKSDENLFIFLDDFHVIDKILQPQLLDIIFGIARGIRIYIKISAIETLTRSYDPVKRIGLEVPQDAQNISLDYNLTTAERAAKHIEAILDSHAQYVGLRSIRRLCGSSDVIPRLTWVAAGVPRDALSLFSQAMTKAIAENRQRITVSNVNMAASETLSIKLKDFESDAYGSTGDLNKTLSTVQSFCIEEKKSNAFLVEIRTENSVYQNILKLVDLRLLHVVSEGITWGKAGQKYRGLILDYGFYTGVRAAQSVELFNQKTKTVKYRDLRALPRLPL